VVGEERKKRRGEERTERETKGGREDKRRRKNIEERRKRSREGSEMSEDLGCLVVRIVRGATAREVVNEVVLDVV
jgi:hypothetical protein